MNVHRLLSLALTFIFDISFASDFPIAFLFFASSAYLFLIAFGYSFLHNNISFRTSRLVTIAVSQTDYYSRSYSDETVIDIWLI